MIASCALAAALAASQGPSLELVDTYATGYDSAAEIISVQASSRRAVLGVGVENGVVDLLDLGEPAHPERLARHQLGLGPGEELTSVAFHPSEDWFLVAVQAADPLARGRVELRAAETGALLAAVVVGVGPDAVYCDPTGRFAAVANEGEPFLAVEREGGLRELISPAGSLSLIRFGETAADVHATEIELQDVPDGTAGFVARKHRRRIERGVDLDGDGAIADELDLDGDGKIGAKNVPLAEVHGGGAVAGDEDDGELLDVPLVAGCRHFLEPEVPAFSPDGEWLFVTLQENNGVLILPTRSPEEARYVGLGTTRHAADTKDDDEIAFEDELFALREPDGIAVTPDGAYFVTADEGDTEPRASKVDAGLPAGGGRTVSVFSARTGELLGDTGDQLDRAAAAAGCYPDGRSDNKGSEPEMITAFALGGTTYAAVGLERADAVALVSLADPAAPRVVALRSVDPDQNGELGDQAPEGIAHLVDGETVWIYAACEASGRLAVLRARLP